ncbi:cytochrome c maturation protein CcmE [bacterium]|nr:MAG: cytochrome c maturation protein CcmE [bacterium]RKZ16551.1 MAG: cytochrome c maturation protein CcmE [bacterium]
MQARIIAGIVIIVGLVGYLAFLGFEDGKSYYVTCDQVAAQESEYTDTNLRLAGIVVDGSITRDGDILTFSLEYDGATYPVRYIGLDPVPDTFKDGVEAVVDGRLLADGSFEGKKIQAKCASKYESDGPDAQDGYGGPKPTA